MTATPTTDQKNTPSTAATSAATPPPPDVTVVVIAYNDADRLPRAVRSVLAQTHRALEVVISDDHSTDATPEVARSLAAADPRVRHLRLPENSGGCSVPRNRALDVATAPYVMFLDSDDELPPDAVAKLLAAHRAREVDFVMGAVRRVRVDTGKSSLWMPHLVTERRTVEGIDQEPELLFEHLSTSKMYARAFLDRAGLRFPEGIHYEDQLFSAQAYCLARAFTVIPEPVYVWYIEPYAATGSASISNQRDRLENVADRIHVQRLIDAFLEESGHGAIRPEKDYKFLKHDFRMYAGDLPRRDPEWLAGFAELVTPYLDTLAPEAYARLPRTERVVLRLVRDGRLEEARRAARGLGLPVGPRHVSHDERGHVYWGEPLPRSREARTELDLSEEGVEAGPLSAALFRHEVRDLETGPGTVLRCTVRTYDPLLRLPVGPQVARLVLAPGGRRYEVAFRSDPVLPGVFEGRVRFDPGQAPLPVQGFDGVRHPVVELRQGRGRHTAPLLGPLDFPPVSSRPRAYGGTVEHVVTVSPEAAGTARIEVRWRPAGPTAKLGPLAGRLSRSVVSRAAKVIRGALR
ncbi:glycosyltransferase family 2 protein [Streptomyces sp. DSM 41982]|uniref:Glycosyltransferase family 2 protein n=1 Tax=Streptomyces evansiae TaxID=3075535 RepID=A0ABD5E9K0_9ACTN|nr:MULTISPECIES: glycosyltransferase family 2 protein [unclassified Streptomyces]MDT0417472.1 glycosyltransferase family 2 protein [Streptomyces sp. DSM 41982]SCE32895.1 Glycosyl transferase family 2 [Streptomyces sp. SolWspMP-sol7th]